MTLRGRGRRRRGCSPRATISTRCARPLRPRLRAQLAAATGAARAQRPARLGRSATLPRTHRAAGHGRRCARLPGAGRRGRRASACACSRRPAAQRAAMHAGTRRLLALTVPSPLRAVAARADQAGAALTLAGAPHGGAGARARRRARRRARSSSIDVGAAGRPGTRRASPRCASTSPPAARRQTARRSSRRSSRSSTPRATCARAGRAARRSGAAPGPPRRRRPARRPRPPRLRDRYRRRPAARTSRATCAPRRAAWSACPTPPRPTATGWASCTSSSASTAAAATPARPVRRRRCVEIALDAAGAARQPVRAGPRRARAGVGEADPPGVGERLSCAQFQPMPPRAGGGCGKPNPDTPAARMVAYRARWHAVHQHQHSTNSDPRVGFLLPARDDESS